jgi:predicted HTH transcriptional regulator
MKELSESIGVSVKAIEKQLENLKKQGKIEREEPNKGGTWKVIKSGN